MTRSSTRPAVAVGLAALLLGYVGCRSSTTSESAAPTAETSTQKPAEPKPAPTSKLFADWPTPAGALLISGEQLGYLEPCGCTEGQAGGLLRRYDLADRLRADQKWPLVLIDLGSLIKDPATARGGPEQAKLKFHTALAALTLMGYDALALSPEDLKVGVDEAVGQFLGLKGKTPRIVAANVEVVVPEAGVVPSIVTQAGPIKVGITSVVDPEKLKSLKDPSLDLLVVKPIDETLPSVLADLEKKTDVQVLLVQGAPESAKPLAKKYPGFDIVVGTSPSADPAESPEPLNDGATLLVTVGQRGKYVGVVGLYKDPKEKLRYQRITLNTRYNGPAKPMKSLIEDEFRMQLKDLGVVENFPRHDFVNGTRDARFLGAEACKSCHPNTFAKWASTKHAHAFEALEKDPKPNVTFDAECVTCHTTGFEYNSGWKSPSATPYLKGNQCENCHGPGSQHAADPDNKDMLAPMKLTADQADKNRLCLRCHDEDNSPHFDFAKYWGQVIHKQLDTYTDPTVHKPLPAAK
jgi:Cytochrome c554 and c-prime